MNEKYKKLLDFLDKMKNQEEPYFKTTEKNISDFNKIISQIKNFNYNDIILNHNSYLQRDRDVFTEISLTANEYLIKYILLNNNISEFVNINDNGINRTSLIYKLREETFAKRDIIIPLIYYFKNIDYLDNVYYPKLDIKPNQKYIELNFYKKQIENYSEFFENDYDKEEFIDILTNKIDLVLKEKEINFQKKINYTLKNLIVELESDDFLKELKEKNLEKLEELLMIGTKNLEKSKISYKFLSI